ncbi:MAG: hypothetical protein KAW41_06300 [Candidatus Diapherotrites archaeon]|nr:hypothetical protein [Candidatus Diapherotrites archaeon]
MTAKRDAVIAITAAVLGAIASNLASHFLEAPLPFWFLTILFILFELGLIAVAWWLLDNYIICPMCSGTAKLKCQYCTNGFLVPRIIAQGITRAVLQIDSRTGGYSYVITLTSLTNKGYKGKVDCEIVLKDQRFYDTWFEEKKRINIEKMGVNMVKKEIMIPLDKERYDVLKQRIGREPVKEDFIVDIKCNPILKNAPKCHKCSGTGRGVCPKCRGRRVCLSGRYTF